VNGLVAEEPERLRVTVSPGAERLVLEHPDLDRSITLKRAGAPSAAAPKSSAAPSGPALLAGKPLAAWLETFKGPAPAKRRADALEAFGAALRDAPEEAARLGAAAETLRLHVKDSSSLVRAKAAWALRFLGRAAAPAADDLVARTTGDGDPKVRAAAAGSLGALAPEASKKPDATSVAALQALERCLADKDANVRAEALRAVARWRKHAAHLAPQAVAFLKDSTPAIRHAAIEACRALGAPTRDVVAPLTALAGSAAEGKDARLAAIEYLGAVGPSAESAAPTLQRLRNDPDLGPAAQKALDAMQILDPGGR
jgi:HEAT repeat protein